MFEPTRLAAAHLADAYAQVVPTLRRTAKVLAADVPLTEVNNTTAAFTQRGGRP